MESEKLKTGLTSFGWNLYRCLSENKGNVFISPHSVSAALMLVCLGAKGKTAGQILNAIGAGDIDSKKVHSLYKSVNDVLTKASEDDGTELFIGNRLFPELSVKINDSYIKESAHYYEVTVGNMDFCTKAEDSRVKINKWVENQTKEKIKDLLPSGSVNGNTILVLANAIYFKAKWDKPFKVEKTQKSDFWITASDKVQVDMMNAELDLPFTMNEDLKCSLVAIPYTSEGITMIIVRPDQVDGLGTLEQKLSADKLSTLCTEIGMAFKAKVDIALPKFTMTQSSKLTTVLPALGICDMFHSSKADLSGLSTESNIAVTDVFHKAYIEVSEEGTEAAAASAVMISRMMLPPKQNFTCDRPFMFLLREQKTGAVLFIGRYSKPE